jgi:hypothetical protein
MRTKVLLGLAVALMLVVSVATIGSNMGFKISIPLTANVNNLVALPYYNSYTDAASIWADVANVSEVDYLDPATDTWIPYFGFDAPPVSTNFAINATNFYALIVKVSATGNWIVVGSHNPTSGIFTLGANVNNVVSIPYHATATNAATLWSQVGANVTELDSLDSATDTWVPYFGFEAPPISTNFTLTPGTAYIIKVSASTPYTPAHY